MCRHMQLARVIGTVVASQKYEGLEGVKFLLVQPLDHAGRPVGDPCAAADTVRAGPGELVYTVGSREAALALDPWFVPVDLTIVGIVADVRHFGPAHAAPPMAYLPHGQEAQSKMTLLLRGDASMLPDATGVQALAQSLSGGASVIQSRPLAALADAQTARPRAAALLLGAFTAAGALLALVGLFSVVDYFAVHRRGEFALRLAVGARARDLGRLVVGDATRLALLGGGIGAGIALFAAPLLASLVPGAADAATRVPFVALGAILLAAALFALAPAHRAARTTPALALAGE